MERWQTPRWIAIYFHWMGLAAALLFSCLAVLPLFEWRNGDVPPGFGLNDAVSLALQPLILAGMFYLAMRLCALAVILAGQWAEKFYGVRSQ
jgi:hypothetical protein